MIIIANLKKSIRVKASRPLVQSTFDAVGHCCKVIMVRYTLYTLDTTIEG